MKVRMLISILCFTLFADYASAQTIPAFSGTTAENKNISIPRDSNGRYALICFASSRKAQADLETWLDPVYNRYIARTGFMDDMFDVDVFFIPVFSGAEGSMQESVRKKFIETAQHDLWPHLVFCDKGLKEILKPLNMTRDELPYFFFLDKTGKIVYRTSGAFTEDKFDAIDELVE